MAAMAALSESDVSGSGKASFLGMAPQKSDVFCSKIATALFQ
jgi:hypothetical protein